MKGGKKKKPVWAGRVGENPDALCIEYTAGRDVKARPPADEALITYDIRTNQAHTVMLWKQGIITKSKARAVLRALKQIERDVEEGQFSLDPALEDVHMNIESRVAEIAGKEAAGVMHTGRSRNDQSATDVRLYVKDQTLTFASSLLDLVRTILKKAPKHVKHVMPGHTHYQPAAITMFGHFLTSYVQMLERDVRRFKNAFDLMNRCPLGAAAAYGTSWNIDRKLTALLLGFEDVQENTIDAVTNRWEAEADLVYAVATMMEHLSIMSQDLIMLSTPPREWVRISDSFVTGSSIMPQKRNPDFAEVTRAKAALVNGYLNSLLGIAKGALSGYNRDTQWTKYIVIDAIEECKDAPAVFTHVIETLEVNAAEMKKACRVGFINAVEVADFIAARFTIPFRTCHHLVARAVKDSEAAGELQLEAINRHLGKVRKSAALSVDDWKILSNPALSLLHKNHIGAPHHTRIMENIDHLKTSLRIYNQWIRSVYKKNASSKKLLKENISHILK